MLMPATGGLTIGLVGADGSGKSTLTEMTSRWLGWKLESRCYYLGSKEPSRRSRALYVLFRALRRGHRECSETLGRNARTADVVRAGRDLALGLHHLSIGRDRRRRYERARRDANGGTVVLFDRFPLEHLRTDDTHRLLDGPQFATAVGPACNRAARALVAAEERLYRRFVLPDQLVVLHVSPRVAVARKPDHEFATLETKGRAIVTLARAARDHGALGVVELDADLPLDRVLRDVKRTVWDAL
jgi:thymidylate kinase